MYIEKFGLESNQDSEKNVEIQSVENLEKEIKDPTIEGFEETENCKIPNTKAKEFLKNTFGSDIFQKIKIDKIIKDEEYYISSDRYWNCISQYDEHVLKINKLLDEGIIRIDIERGGMLIAENKEKYIKAEMFLEDVNDSEKLQHTFNVAAGTGINIFGLYVIHLGNFDAKKVSDFDYLKNINLSDEDKMQVYILSTLVHEMTHQYESQLKDKNFNEYQRIVDEYKRIIEEEFGVKRAKFVSDYVLRHKEIYGSNENELFREDLAEAVRIYTINPDYLRENYPRRFEYIKNNFSFIKQGSVVESVRGFSEYNNEK